MVRSAHILLGGTVVAASVATAVTLARASVGDQELLDGARLPGETARAFSEEFTFVPGIEATTSA